jgi:hypothetical protein
MYVYICNTFMVENEVGKFKLLTLVKLGHYKLSFSYLCVSLIPHFVILIKVNIKILEKIE